MDRVEPGRFRAVGGAKVVCEGSCEGLKDLCRSRSSVELEDSGDEVGRTIQTKVINPSFACTLWKCAPWCLYLL